MKELRPRLTAPLVIAALLVTGVVLVATVQPAQAQCLSEAECDALRAQMQEFREDRRAVKQQVRELKQQARALPQGSAEREAIRDQIRALREASKGNRDEVRAVVQQLRSGCKNC